mgnify:FL=1
MNENEKISQFKVGESIDSEYIPLEVEIEEYDKKHEKKRRKAVERRDNTYVRYTKREIGRKPKTI